MSLFGGIADWLTGGRDEQAEQALNNAMADYQNIQTPTQAQLSLPELQNYVNAGLMTPAQMQSYLQTSNAYNTESVPQTGTAAQVAALNQLAGVANAGANGTPVEQAQVAQAVQQMNNSVQGQRGSIEQAMEAKGTPAALIQAALQNQYVGQDAQQEYQNSLQAQAQAYQTALNAMSQGASAGNALQGQQNTQANTVAAAQNAMQQFNASQQQNAAASNAAYQQAANQYNTTNAQNVANQNTQTQNTRTAYNTSQAQQAFEDAMAKAQGEAGVASGQASNYQQMGQQAAGAASSLIGALSTGAGSLSNSLTAGSGPGINGVSEGFQPGIGQISGPVNVAQYAPAGLAHGGILDEHEFCYHDGGICMKSGGMVPGHAPVPGNSRENDIVHAKLSPGEAVIPRTAVQSNLPQVMALIQQGRGGVPRGPMPPMVKPSTSSAHPQDVAAVLAALNHIRMGAAA